MNNNIKIPDITLHNGIKMPSLGFGTAGLDTGEKFENAMAAALEYGYRLFDTAPFYGNEAEVGKFLNGSGIPREGLFISTKLPNAAHAYDDTMEAVYTALENMGLDYLDMFLIHFPVPSVGLYPEAWKALIKLNEEGTINAVGVSNFEIEHLEKLYETSGIVPIVNQIECNPYLSLRPLREYCKNHGIRVMNWFPLGGPSEPLVPYPCDDFKVLVDDPVMIGIGEKYGKSSGQVSLRWAIQNDITPIPKSSKPERIAANRDIFDFELTADDMARIDALDHGRRLGPDPNTVDDMELG
jgi:diketogulonate reductase-like aldo/keto reductase